MTDFCSLNSGLKGINALIRRTSLTRKLLRCPVIGVDQPYFDNQPNKRVQFSSTHNTGGTKALETRALHIHHVLATRLCLPDCRT